MQWNQRPTTYPTLQEIDHWVEQLHHDANALHYTCTDLGRSGVTPVFGNGHTTNYSRFWKFDVRGRHSFYAIWQPALKSPAPVVIHLPGYGAETSILPELVQAGYHVLHVSPLGYMTPEGSDEKQKVHGDWPVFGYTIYGMKRDYRDWIIDVMIAVRELQQRNDVLPQHFSFFGTSQGGGTSLLMGSIYKDLGVKAVVADVPFLTDIPKAKYAFDRTGLTPESIQDIHWKRLGYIDTMSHLHRLTMPILLTAGENDTACPPETISGLFDHLETTKSMNYFLHQGHAYTRQVIHLGLAWLNIYG